MDKPNPFDIEEEVKEPEKDEVTVNDGHFDTDENIQAVEHFILYTSAKKAMEARVAQLKVLIKQYEERALRTLTTQGQNKKTFADTAKDGTVIKSTCFINRATHIKKGEHFDKFIARMQYRGMNVLKVDMQAVETWVRNMIKTGEWVVEDGGKIYDNTNACYIEEDVLSMYVLPSLRVKVS